MPGLQIHVACCGADHLTFEMGEGKGLVWVISEKNILQTDFEGKNYCKETPGEKKYPTLKKNVTPLNVREKSITRGLGKLIFTQSKSPLPPSKVK